MDPMGTQSQISQLVLKSEIRLSSFAMFQFSYVIASLLLMLLGICLTFGPDRPK